MSANAGTARDGLARKNVHSIVMQIPVSALVKTGTPALTATTNTISLTPMVSGIALVGTTDGGKTVEGWKCGPAAANPVATKYLPSSCRGTYP